jgi:hypothetical protein
MKEPKSWHPAEYKKEDVQAIQTLAAYARLAVEVWDEKAKGAPPPPPSPFQVKLALDWIVLKAAQTYDNSFEANDPNGRIGAFLEGRRSVGQQIIKLMTWKIEALFGSKEKE